MDELRIAIADDEQQILDSVQSALNENITDKTLKFYTFKSLTKLIKFLNDDSSRVDLLLLDCFFPTGKTGLEMLPDIRYAAPTLPIIMLTSNDNPTDFAPFLKYNFEYVKKADSIEHTQSTLQIYINKAITERNRFRSLKIEINATLAKFVPPSNIINAITTGQLLFNDFIDSDSELDLSFIGNCWGRAFEAAVRRAANAVDRGCTLSEAIGKLTCNNTVSKEFKDVLYTLKNMRNVFSHPGEEDYVKPLTSSDIRKYRKLLLGEKGYTSGVLVTLLQYK